MQNDPVNFVDPLGLCSFNINTGGEAISEESRNAMEREITRIFGRAGHSVAFNDPTGADRTYNLNLTSLEPSHLPTALGSTRTTASGVDNYGALYLTRVRNSLSQESNPTLRNLGRHPANYGTALGRVAAHETGHYLLQLKGYHPPSDLMRAQFIGDARLFLERENASFEFNSFQRRLLNRLCDQPVVTTPGQPGTEIVPRPGGGGGGGGRGGGFPSPGGRGRGPFAGWTSFDFLRFAFGSGGGAGPRREVVTVRIY